MANWIQRLPLAQRYGADLEHLLQQLPMMLSVDSRPARQAYHTKLMQAMIQVAYVQARVIQLSDTLPPSERSRQIDHVFSQAADRMKQLTDWLHV